MDSERDDAMSTTRIRIDLDDPGSLPEGRVDYAVLDSTTEADLIAQQREDDAEAMRDKAPEIALNGSLLSVRAGEGEGADGVVGERGLAL